MNKNNALPMIKETFYQVTKVLTLASGFAALGLVLFYIIFVSKGFYHGDCSDTILWAQAMIEGKTITNPDFRYAALLPFGGNLIMAPLVAIFGYSMKAQIIGMVIFALLFTYALVFFCKSAKLNYKWCSLTTAFVLLILCSSEKLREIFWCHIIYYSLGVFFLLLGLGLVLTILNKEKFSMKHFVILFIWTTLCSINGSQSFTLYTIPVIGALIAERFFDKDTPFISKKNSRYGLVILNMATAVLAGLILAKVINGDVKASYQEAYSRFDNKSDWVNNLLSFIPSFLSLCGVAPTDEELFSASGILILIRIIGVLMLLIIPIVMLFMYKKFEERSYKIVLLTHVILSTLLILGWVFGMLNAANWRLTPLVVTSSILCIMFIRWLFHQKDFLRFSVLLSIPTLLMLIIFTTDVTGTALEKQSDANKQLVSIGNYLKSEGLEYGYATFWNSNSITLLTDEEVKIRCIGQSNGNLYARMYQTNVNWYKDNSYSEYFLLLSENEYFSYLSADDYAEPMEVKYYEDHYILVYNYNIMELK